MASDEDSRAEAWELLTAVGLKPWLDENGFGLDTVQDWHAVLSGGQKQRLAWVRMYHHKPAFALIDEGTSAVDRESVDQLFLHAKKMGITMLTISHHVRLPSLRTAHFIAARGWQDKWSCVWQDAVDVHHSRALDLAKGGKWSFTEGVVTPRESEDDGADKTDQVQFRIHQQLAAYGAPS